MKKNELKPILDKSGRVVATRMNGRVSIVGWLLDKSLPEFDSIPSKVRRLCKAHILKILLATVRKFGTDRVQVLRAKLERGEINGERYYRFDGNDKVCLIGTLAHGRRRRSTSYVDLNKFCESIGHTQEPYSPAEFWFRFIKPGTTPDNNLFAQVAHECCEEILQRTR